MGRGVSPVIVYSFLHVKKQSVSNRVSKSKYNLDSLDILLSEDICDKNIFSHLRENITRFYSAVLFSSSFSFPSSITCQWIFN